MPGPAAAPAAGLAGCAMTPLFVTERLQARHLGMADVDAMVDVYGDADAMRFVGERRALARSECEHWVDVTRGNVERRGYGMLALEARADARVIGFCGLVHPGGQPEAEVKYALHRDVWGRGLATEAVLGLVDWGRRAHGLERVIATVAPANLASQRVLLKAGFALGPLRNNADGTQTQLFHWLSGSTA